MHWFDWIALGIGYTVIAVAGFFTMVFLLGLICDIAFKRLRTNVVFMKAFWHYVRMSGKRAVEVEGGKDESTY